VRGFRRACRKVTRAVGFQTSDPRLPFALLRHLVLTDHLCHRDFKQDFPARRFLLQHADVSAPITFTVRSARKGGDAPRGPARNTTRQRPACRHRSPPEAPRLPQNGCESLPPILPTRQECQGWPNAEKCHRGPWDHRTPAASVAQNPKHALGQRQASSQAKPLRLSAPCAKDGRVRPISDPDLLSRFFVMLPLRGRRGARPFQPCHGRVFRLPGAGSFHGPQTTMLRCRPAIDGDHCSQCWPRAGLRAKQVL
jgi:hypothetical protein